MARILLQFYLLAVGIGFAITFWVGARGAPVVEVFSLALLAWPAAGFVLIARDRVARIKAKEQTDR